jgi:hypothetical protein
MSAKRITAIIRNAGPYEAHSIPDGSIVLHPKWPRFPPHTPMDGGGPGLISRLALAQEIEDFLNSRIKSR